MSDYAWYKSPIDLDDLAKKTAKRLKKIYTESEASDSFPKNGLVFPYQRIKKNDELILRLSEQEIRSIFASELEKAIGEKEGIYYSLETPTRLVYRGFAQKKGIEPEVFDPDLKEDYHPKPSSGSIDLSIYYRKVNMPSINMEFKFGQASIHNIKKDLLKLLSEESEGIFFHVYKKKAESLEKIKSKILDTFDYLESHIESKRISVDLKSSKFNINKIIQFYLIDIISGSIVYYEYSPKTNKLIQRKDEF